MNNLNSRKVQILQRSLSKLKINQLLPCSSKIKIDKEVLFVLEVCNKIDEKAQELYRTKDQELTALSILMNKVSESARSSLILLAFGLFEDHISMLRRNIEATIMCVYIGGTGDLISYMNDEYSHGRKKWRPVSQIAKDCPFEFAKKVYSYFSFYSNAMHPNAPFLGHLRLHGEQDRGAVQEYIDSYVDEVYCVSIVGFQVMTMDYVILELAKLYEKAFKKYNHVQSSPSIKLLNHVFEDPRKIESIYNEQNIYAGISNTMNFIFSRFKSMLGSEPSYDNASVVRLRDVISNDELIKELDANPEAEVAIHNMLVKWRVGTFMGTRFTLE